MPVKLLYSLGVATNCIHRNGPTGSVTAGASISPVEESQFYLAGTDRSVILKI